MTEELSCGKVNEEKYLSRAIDVLMFRCILILLVKILAKLRVRNSPYTIRYNCIVKFQLKHLLLMTKDVCSAI